MGSGSDKGAGRTGLSPARGNENHHRRRGFQQAGHDLAGAVVKAAGGVQGNQQQFGAALPGAVHRAGNVARLDRGYRILNLRCHDDGGAALGAGSVAAGLDPGVELESQQAGGNQRQAQGGGNAPSNSDDTGGFGGW